jgi:hypothetical protein
MAPTYLCREPGIEHSDGHRGPHFFFPAVAGPTPGVTEHYVFW